MRIRASIAPRGAKIWVRFPYDPVLIDRAKRVPGASFVGVERGGPAWQFPLSLKTIKQLRETFGYDLEPDDELRSWGITQTREQRQLRAIATADDAEVERLKDSHPDIAKALRPYQRADVMLMSKRSLINANDMGLGKCLEVIAAVCEAGLEDMPHLIIAPTTSLVPTWEQQINQWLPAARVLTDDSPSVRRLLADKVVPGSWYVINPDMLKGKGSVAEKLWKIKWGSITIDEFHKMGLSNPNTQFAAAIRKLKAERKWAMSGTPLGGKAINFWGALHWLSPSEFPSRWNWAKDWLKVVNNGFGHDIGDIQLGREDEFYIAHAHWIIRRLKREALPGSPPKVYHEVWCDATPAQRKQYDKFALDAEIRIDEERLVGTSVLAEYQQLKMFAFSRCEIVKRDINKRDGERITLKNLRPTTESGKLPALLKQLNDRRCFARDGEQAIIGSQSARIVRLIYKALSDLGFSVGMITGDVTGAKRTAVIKQFQRGKVRLVVVTTTAAGVSLNLESASSVHIIDETWNPDDQLQLEDRGDRGSRTTPLHVYRYRTRNTVEEEVAQVVDAKAITASNILDIRRNEFKSRSSRA